MHLPGHNFTGPGTKLNKRLNADLTPKAWSKPVNRVDQVAYQYDICYVKYKDTKTRNEVCDKNMLAELDGIYNPTLRDRIDRGIVRPIIGTKKRFGMGLKKERSENERSEAERSKSNRVSWSSPLATELHKPVIKNFPKRKVYVNGIDKIWAADLVEMQAFSRFNRGVKYLLTVIDVFSKYGWMLPLKDKTGVFVVKALKEIFISDLAWSRLGLERAELSEIAVDREVFRTPLGLLPWDSSQRKSGHENEKMNECVGLH